MCDEESSEPLSEIAAAYEKIEEMEANLKDAREAFLRRFGWNYTCGNPDCCWYWTRTLKDGRVVLVSEATAISFTLTGDYLGKL